MAWLKDIELEDGRVVKVWEVEKANTLFLQDKVEISWQGWLEQEFMGLKTPTATANLTIRISEDSELQAALSVVKELLTARIMSAPEFMGATEVSGETA